MVYPFDISSIQWQYKLHVIVKYHWESYDLYGQFSLIFAAVATSLP